MEKDKTIISLIQKLDFLKMLSHVEIVDYWDADLCAFGLKRDNRLVYISTYNYVNHMESKFDFDFEIIDQTDADKIMVIKKGRAVSEAELVAAIKRFLGV